MTVKVLVTGSRGFIGSALLQDLSSRDDVEVLEYIRDTTDSDLCAFVQSADVVVHLAGEVRPNSSEDAFKSSHTLLTEKLINYLVKYEKKIPVLMASSIHAENPKNAYGQTKRETELMLEAYSKEGSSLVNIFRLTHVFGPGCKPNYNSVLTTWIFNLINNVPVDVYDRSIQMRYTFVDDIVKDINNFIFNSSESSETYRYSDRIYSVTLGNVIDLLRSFHYGLAFENSEELEPDFIEKLKLTYLSYLPQGREI